MIPIIPVLGHGGAPAQTGEISLTLEEIYFITMLVMLVSPILLFKLARIKDKKLIYVLITLGFIFLTLDYLLLKFVIFA